MQSHGFFYSLLLQSQLDIKDYLSYLYWNL